jgi:mono/diheme cytochrome c family protein
LGLKIEKKKMNKIAIISIFTLAVATLVACSDVKRKPGSVYMPDMAYSRAYETYAPRDSNFTSDASNWSSNGKTKIFYNNQPVTGTVSRSESYVMHLAKDAVGDSINYVASKQLVSPIVGDLDSTQLKEAERIYLINCGICHGTKLDGNGPLYKDGAGPYPAAPKNLITLDMPDGQMFYSISYGKNLMGGYEGQVSAQQRWNIIKYIRSMQQKAKPAATTVAKGTLAAATTTTMAVKK